MVGLFSHDYVIVICLEVAQICTNFIIMQGKNLVIVLFLVITFGSCKKETAVENPAPLPEVEMIYSNLNDLEIKYLKDAVIDINKDTGLIYFLKSFELVILSTRWINFSLTSLRLYIRVCL